ncbi:unnamed protein product, partial [Prorocentrum cordatum]
PLGREVPVPAQTGGHLRAAVPGPRHGRVRSGQPRQRGHRGAGPEGHRARAQAEPGRVQQLPGGGGQHHLRSQPHPPAAEAVIGQAPRAGRPGSYSVRFPHYSQSRLLGPDPGPR